MNKLMGFYELKDSGLPAVPWKVFDNGSVMDNRYLWTVRTAVDKGVDLNLPRIVGKTAQEAFKGATDLYERYKNKGIIVYYPYFIADKSGTMQIDSDKLIIEAVDKDLWNLVTYNNKDVTIIKNNSGTIIDGNEGFLAESEINELYSYAKKVRLIFKDYIIQGKTLLLEWSYAYDTNINRQPIGDRYLVFYEIREIWLLTPFNLQGLGILTGKTSPFNRKSNFIDEKFAGGVTDYFEYVVLIRNSKAAIPYN